MSVKIVDVYGVLVFLMFLGKHINFFLQKKKLSYSSSTFEFPFAVNFYC